jgi:hypothetical protein
MKPVCFYTFVSDNYYLPCGTQQLITSFKRFHPDIPLVVFRQDIVNQIIDPEKKFMDGQVNWLNAKPIFAKLLAFKYELVVNIDADSVVLGRLDEVIDGDYDIGSVTNFNQFENRHLENITDEMYLQAGLVASRIPEFWDVWMAESLKNNWQYKCAENDSLNIVVYNQLENYKLKIFDKDKNYLGCKLLGLEDKCYLEDNKVMCNGEQVKIYHYAKGPGNMPKNSHSKLISYGFKPEVIDFIESVGNYGITEFYGDLLEIIK